MNFYHNKNCFLLVFLAISTISSVAISSPQDNIVQKLHSPVALKGLAENPIYYKGWICKSCETPRVHSATATSTIDGSLLAAWYGGTREGARDVQIYMSTFQRVSKTWEKPRAIIGVDSAERDLSRYIKKLGNPVLLTHPNGEIWLFYVSVSAGGWSGSQVNLARSKDGGETWTTTNRFVTSPFFNVSTLVKGRPFIYEDGTIGLPVYHELAGKFAEILRIDTQGKLLEKNRISWGRQAIQPEIVSLGSGKLKAYLRDVSSTLRIWVTSSNDFGRSWERLTPMDIPNPDSAVAAINTYNNRTVLVVNDLEAGRHRLSLYTKIDQGAWKRIKIIESALPTSGERYAYPYLTRDSDGMIHLFYTWNRKGIRHVYFSPSWIEERMK